MSALQQHTCLCPYLRRSFSVLQGVLSLLQLLRLGLPYVAPGSPLLGALRHIPLGVGVFHDCFVFDCGHMHGVHQRRCALTFVCVTVQGAELATPTEDYLSTEPRVLLGTVDTVLQAYESQKGKTSMLGQAAEFMQPVVIDRMRHVRNFILRQYM